MMIMRKMMTINKISDQSDGVMRRHDMTNKKTMTKTNTMIMTNTENKDNDIYI